MSDQAKLKVWLEQVDRVNLASVTLKAAIKLFAAAGENAQASWDVVEKAREVYGVHAKRERILWQRVTGMEADDQQEMPGMPSAPGPRGKGPKGAGGLDPSKAVQAGQGPRLLPGKTESAGG